MVLRSRLRKLRPRELRSIRHWGIELAVVVVGVLLALWAAEWADDRREATRDEILIEAVRDEVRYNLLVLSIWRAHGACHAQQLAHIGRLLDETEGDWPGVRRDALFIEGEFDPILPGIYPLFGGMVESTAWEAAVEAGAIQRMESEDQGVFRTSAIAGESYRSRMEQAFEARDRLRALAYPGRLAGSDRFAARNDLAILASTMVWLDRDFDYGKIGLREREVAQLQEQIDEWNERLKGSGISRECWTQLEMPAEVSAAMRQ